MNDARSDAVSRQYAKWTYPQPIEDLEAWHGDHWDRLDPRHAHRILWPDRTYRGDLHILIAGCGTNQAATIAYSNPDATVVGVDISQPSLDHQTFLKDKHGLRNLELRLLPIEELPSMGRDFDLIISSGVLHHMADPNLGIKALAECLRADGVIGLMLYAKYGRTGINVLQSVFRDLGLSQTDESLRVVKQAMQWLPEHHLARGYLSSATDLAYDAGLVDTFLHNRERTYTTDDCIEFVESAGLVFAGWLNKSPYYPHEWADDRPELYRDFYAALDTLPERTLWSASDRLRSTNGAHFFLACHPGRPKEQYTIDFSSLDSLDYVPQWRIGCGLDGATAYRQKWRFKLTEERLAFVAQIDGQRSIREIATLVRQSGAGPSGSPAKVEAYARKLFRELWRLDLTAVAFGTPSR